jgi:hypothetical protein
MIEFGRVDHGTRIAEAAGFICGPSDVVISRTDDWGKLLGGVVLYDYTGKCISMHVAGFDPHWISRDMLWTVFHYPFAQLKCASIFCQLRSSNLKALEFVGKIGFKQEVVIPEVFPDGDMIVGRLRAEECRWLNIKPKHITFGGKNGR